jgi:hypothetical protein
VVESLGVVSVTPVGGLQHPEDSPERKLWRFCGKAKVNN